MSHDIQIRILNILSKLLPPSLPTIGQCAQIHPDLQTEHHKNHLWFLSFFPISSLILYLRKNLPQIFHTITTGVIVS